MIFGLETNLIIIIAVIVVIIITAISSIKVVSESEVYIVERIGKYHRTIGAGLHIIIPLIDKVASQISLKEYIVDLPSNNLITKDKVKVRVGLLVFFKVDEPKTFCYSIGDNSDYIEQLIQTTLMSILGGLTVEESLVSRSVIRNEMLKVLEGVSENWGIKIGRVEVKDIEPPKEVREYLESKVSLQRDRDESLLKAEAETKAAILKAEADKKVAILKAEGEAEALKLIRKAEDDEPVEEYSFKGIYADTSEIEDEEEIVFDDSDYD